MTDTTCPTCGTPCTVGGEGHGPGATRYYVPAWEAEVEELRRQLTRHVDLVNERNAQVSELRRQVEELRRQLAEARKVIAEDDYFAGDTHNTPLPDLVKYILASFAHVVNALDKHLFTDEHDGDEDPATIIANAIESETAALKEQLAEAQADQRAAYEEGAAAAQGACREVMIELREARDIIATLREAVREGIDWLSSRPDRTEGDIATACRMQTVLDVGKANQPCTCGHPKSKHPEGYNEGCLMAGCTCKGFLDAGKGEGNG